MSTELAHRPRVIRQYSTEERSSAVALYDQTGNLEKTSKVLGIPLSTLAGWVNSGDFNSELRNQKAQDLAAKFENAAHEYLELARKKSKKAAFQHLMTGAAIAVDKSQLLRNLPTSIALNVEKNELTLVLSGALSNALDLPEAIDITPVESME